MSPPCSPSSARRTGPSWPCSPAARGCVRPSAASPSPSSPPWPRTASPEAPAPWKPTAPRASEQVGSVGAMSLHIARASPAESPLLRHLYPLYLHDLSEFSGGYTLDAQGLWVP